MNERDENDDFEDSEDTYSDPIDIPDNRTESEKVADENLEKIDSFFSQLQPGATLLIERSQPSWCSGILEEITVSNEALTLDYFIETWGGHVLGVKLRNARGRFSGGSYKIPLHSYPPKVYGEVIRKSDVMDRLRGTEKESSNLPMVINNPPPAPPQSTSLEKLVTALPAMLPILLKWIESAAERRQREMLLMMKMMNPGNGGAGGIGDITKLGGAMVELQKAFGAAGGGGGELTDFIPQALGILESVLQKKDQPTQTPRITAAPPNVRQIRQPSNAAQTIADMNPKNAAQTIIAALGSMPADKRGAAIAEFMSEYRNTMSDDDEEEGYSDEGTNNRG